MRLLVPIEGTDDLGRGLGVANWWSRPRIDRGFRVKIPCRFGVKAANRQPQPDHRGRRLPLWVPATSVEESGSPIGGPDPSFPFDFL
ncbi:hypothetical protein CRG98_023063 [Punica granatum]|uniref:Uncharacterized protein n=1 Tax=Punica granatum TaxID=22663 RepID=A0A2I0JJW4_PUNGR|nr:hypothetical protein CRG98_023063 [Punica granatum]